MIWLLIPTMALIHRLRGGLIQAIKFKLTYYIWPFVGLSAWLLGMPWPAAILWAFGYFLWSIFGWMDEIDTALGIVPVGQIVSHSWDVEDVEDAAFHKPVLAVYLRAAIYLVPLAIVMPYVNQNPAWLLIVIATFWPAYWIGYSFIPANPAIIAETAIGASWGVSMALATLMPL